MTESINTEAVFPDIFESNHELNFQKNTGKTVLIVSFSEYHSQKLSAVGVSYARLHGVTSQFEFQLYNPIEVGPKNQVIFLNKDNLFKLEVLHGSSHYITDINSTAVVKLERQQSSTLDIRPLMEGHVLITVTDACWPKDRAVSDTLVSKVHKLRVHVRDMVQIGDTTSLEVIAIDKRGEAFPDAQYKHLSFESQIDNKDVLSVRQQDGSRYMTVHATSLGSSSITITTKKEADGVVVTSTPTLVHVFPPLQLVPERLILLPGALIQLQWRGGPPARAELHFDIDSAHYRKSVAQIDSKTGLLHAKEVGETAVVATVFTYVANEGQNTKSGNATAQVVVKHLKGIRIVSASSMLLVGEEMVLEVGGNEGETPFSWYKLDIGFSWEVGSRVIQLDPLNKGSIDEDSFGVRAFAKAAGRTVVTVRIVKCLSWPQLVGLSASTTITTIEPLRLLSPASVLIAPNSHYKIQTNYDHDPLTRSSLVYEVLDTEEAWANHRSTDHPVVDLSNSGLITTTNSVGSMHIRISERSGQSVVLKVTVKPIYHVSLSPQHSSPYGIPVGKSQNLDIIVRDELGAQFDSYDGISFDYFLNVLDVVAVSLVHQGNATQTDTKGYLTGPALKHQIVDASGSTSAGEGAPVYFGHSSLRVDGLSPGYAILRLYVRGNDNSKMIHFPIRVMNSIEPSNIKLHVGGEVQFSTSFLQEDSACKSSAWSSSDSTIVSVDSEGRGAALKPGEVQIYFNCTVHTHTTVRVVPISQVTTGDQQVQFSSNDLLIVHVPLHFQGKASDSGAFDNLVDLPGVKQNINFRCAIKSHLVSHDASRVSQPPLRVSAETENGAYHCVVFIKLGQLPNINSIGDLLNASPLQVEATTVEGQSVVTALSLAKTTPIFEVEESGKDSLYLDAAKTVNVFWHLPERFAAPQLEVHVSDSQLEVQEVKGTDSTKRSFLIRLGNPAGSNGEYIPFHNAKVTLYYPQTGQQVSIFFS